MAKRNDSEAVIRLLHHGTTSKYVNCLLWSPWQQLENIATNQEEEETDDQKKTRLSIFPMSVFPCVEEEDQTNCVARIFVWIATQSCESPHVFVTAL